MYPLSGGADHAIRPDFLSVCLCSPHSSGSPVLSVLAGREERSSRVETAETQAPPGMTSRESGFAKSMARELLSREHMDF